MQIQMVTFSEAKEGNAPAEWQDGACGGVVGDGRRARFVVLDGATTAYDPVRWVDQLVRSFAPQAGGSRGPRLESAAMRAWFAEMHDRWAAEARDFDSIIEERKFAEVGSFATLLGFEVDGLDGPDTRPAEEGIWSVLIQGLATEEYGGVARERVPIPHAADPGRRLVRIRIDVITGRRLGARQAVEVPATAT
jgi:hypothetical protein